MSTLIPRSSLQSYQLHLCARGHGNSSPVSTPSRLPCFGKASYNTKHGFCSSVNQGLHLFNIFNSRRSTIKMDLNAIENLNSGAPVSSGSPFPGWLSWMLLTALPILLPFIKNKWGPLMVIKKQVDTAIETVETIAEVVEDVAKEVDKIADEVAEKLPDGSQLKQAICKVDDVAEGIIKGADLTEDLVNKVEEVEKTMETQIENSPKEQQKVESTST